MPQSVNLPLILKVFFISLHTGFIKHSSLNRMVQLSQNLWGTDYNQPVCYLGIQRTLHPFSARHTCSEFKTSPKLVRGIISVFFQLSNGIIESRYPLTWFVFCHNRTLMLQTKNHISTTGINNDKSKILPASASKITIFRDRQTRRIVVRIKQISK